MRTLTTLTLSSLLFLTACPREGDTGDLTDADGDGYAAWEDCNDRDTTIYPGAPETCDGRDNDCDEDIDEGATVTLYRDEDGDGYGNPDLETTGCPGTGGYATEGTDCDDSNDDVHPDAEEWCDGLDNDCDEEVDEDLSYVDWYADDDEDGYGDPDDSINDCEQPSGYIEQGGDCDDTDETINPDATELCDGADNDCDDEVDEADATDATTWYLDGDGDGYGDAADAGTAACAAPSGYLADNTDCDDGDASINPGATEVCDDADTDEDCDGSADDADKSTDAGSMTSWHPDVDGDGFGDMYSSVSSCEAPKGSIADGSDCDDNDGTVNPSFPEICDGVDNDCDGDVDDDDPGVLGTSTWYLDSDGDGYGDADYGVDACTQPTGYVSDGTDCDDDDLSIWVDCPGDTSEPGDTGEASTRDGTYTGDFEIAVVAISSGMKITDSCVGTLEVEVDETAKTHMTGSGTCAFSGLMAPMFGSQTGTMDGMITTDPAAGGGIYLGHLMSDVWVGEFTDDDTLFGEFDGTGSYTGIGYSYTGEFTVER